MFIAIPAQSVCGPHTHTMQQMQQSMQGRTPTPCMQSMQQSMQSTDRMAPGAEVAEVAQEHLEWVLVVKFMCFHTFVGKVGKVVYKSRTHCMWLTVSEREDGNLRFFSTDDSTGEIYDSGWQYNAESHFKFVPMAMFPTCLEACRTFDLKWNWQGDVANYLVHVWFALQEEMMEHNGQKLVIGGVNVRRDLLAPAALH